MKGCQTAPQLAVFADYLPRGRLVLAGRLEFEGLFVFEFEFEFEFTVLFELPFCGLAFPVPGKAITVPAINATANSNNNVNLLLEFFIGVLQS